MASKKSKISQSSIEFIILVAFLLFAFVVFFLIIQENMSDKIRERVNIQIKEISLSVKDEIDFAFSSSEGYRREFKIPENLNGQNYNIQIVEGFVAIDTLNGKYALALPVQNVTGQINRGDNVIKKENGVVLLNV